MTGNFICSQVVGHCKVVCLPRTLLAIECYLYPNLQGAQFYVNDPTFSLCMEVLPMFDYNERGLFAIRDTMIIGAR